VLFDPVLLDDYLKEKEVDQKIDPFDLPDIEHDEDRGEGFAVVISQVLGQTLDVEGGSD
jgi:hypothetical protein